jgi:hypothetical protein
MWMWVLEGEGCAHLVPSADDADADHAVVCVGVEQGDDLLGLLLGFSVFEVLRALRVIDILRVVRGYYL